MDPGEPGRKMSTSVGFDSSRVYLSETEKRARSSARGDRLRSRVKHSEQGKGPPT